MSRTAELQGDLWIPRTMWEKRRQLSGAIQRSMVIGTPMLILSCDSWTTFFSRLDLDSAQVNAAMASGRMEYIQVLPLSDVTATLAGINLKFQGRGIAQVIVDDIDLIVDLGNSETAIPSLFAMVYALKSRFSEILLFSNPLPSQNKVRYLAQMADVLTVHPAVQQNAA
ncbi:MAG: hypothetical protein AB1540_08640 [Bdellovibrionota bacterium]